MSETWKATPTRKLLPLRIVVTNDEYADCANRCPPVMASEMASIPSPAQGGGRFTLSNPVYASDSVKVWLRRVLNGNIYDVAEKLAEGLAIDNDALAAISANFSQTTRLEVSLPEFTAGLDLGDALA